MDVWQTFPHKLENAGDNETKREQIQTWNDWWYNDVEETTKTKIVPLLEWARRNEITVVFSNLVEPEWDATLNPLVQQKKYNEPIINRTNDLYVFLTAKNVGTIYYAGIAINNCILGKPTGMVKMHETGFDVALIEDAALSGEYQLITHEDALEYMRDNLDAEFITIEELKRSYSK